MSSDATFPALSPSAEPRANGRTCRWCGRVHPKGRFQRGCPGPALTHGLRSTLLQAGRLPDQAATARALVERQREIEADLGGAQGLSRVHRDAIRDLLRLQFVGDFLFNRLTQDGPLTGKGRTRAALTAYLLVVDRLVRLRQMVGLARQAKPVTLGEYLQCRVRDPDPREEPHSSRPSSETRDDSQVTTEGGRDP